MQINNKEFNITPEELEKVLKPYEVKKNWVLKRDGKYFYIDDTGMVEWATFKDDEIDYFRLSVGNAYQTKKLAEKAIAVKQALVKVNNMIDELNEKVEQSIIYEYVIKLNKGELFSYFMQVGTINPFIHTCALSEIAEQIIDEMDDELKLIWGV